MTLQRERGNAAWTHLGTLPDLGLEGLWVLLQDGRYGLGAGILVVLVVRAVTAMAAVHAVLTAGKALAIQHDAPAVLAVALMRGRGADEGHTTTTQGHAGVVLAHSAY